LSANKLYALGGLCGCLLENVGVDEAVRLGDPAIWRAAIAALK
jgi:hypothetical protein